MAGQIEKANELKLKTTRFVQRAYVKPMTSWAPVLIDLKRDQQNNFGTTIASELQTTTARLDNIAASTEQLSLAERWKVLELLILNSPTSTPPVSLNEPELKDLFTAIRSHDPQALHLRSPEELRLELERLKRRYYQEFDAVEWLYRSGHLNSNLISNHFGDDAINLLWAAAGQSLRRFPIRDADASSQLLAAVAEARADDVAFAKKYNTGRDYIILMRLKISEIIKILEQNGFSEKEIRGMLAKTAYISPATYAQIRDEPRRSFLGKDQIEKFGTYGAPLDIDSSTAEAFAEQMIKNKRAIEVEEQKNENARQAAEAEVKAGRQQQLDKIVTHIRTLRSTHQIPLSKISTVLDVRTTALFELEKKGTGDQLTRGEFEKLLNNATQFETSPDEILGKLKAP